MNFKKIMIGAVLFAAPILLNATRIAVLADVHVTPGNECEKMLQEVIKEINQSDAQIVIMNGDLTNEGSDEQLKNVKSVLDKIEKALFVIPGNHETNWSQSATKTFVDLWGNDRFVTEVDDYVIVGINCGPYMKMGDGHIKQEDLHWLKSTLDSKVKDGKKVISFNHYPLMPDLDNYVDYVKILEQYPVVAHVNGHYHKYQHYKGGDINCMMVRSLDMKKGNFGFTMMDISDDSVSFYNKQLGVEPVKVQSFAIDTDITPIEVETNKSWIEPDGFNVMKIYADSASIFTRLAIDDKAIYFGNSLGQAKSVDKSTGKLNWAIPTGASLFGRFSVSNDMIYVPTAAQGILKVNAESGVVMDKLQPVGPYVADGLIVGKDYYQGGYMTMKKFDVTNGNLIWSFDSINNYCQAAPILQKGNLIFGAWDSYLYCLDAKTGKLKWKWNNGKSANMLGPGNVVPVAYKDNVIIVAPDRYMTCIDLNTGKTKWRTNEKYRVRESLGCSADGKIVYAKTMDGELIAVDATADEYRLLWVVDMGLGYEHAPCIVAECDGVVYAGSRRGIVTAIDPVEQKMLWSLPLGVSEINGIDVADGRVYVSLIEGTIWRISQSK